MLTATREAKTGYWIESLGKNVYSIEEINYFIYHHIDLIFRDFFSNQLFDYMELELEQPMMANDLRAIADRGGNTGDFVKYILQESYYYNQQELSEISQLVADIDHMGWAERMKIQGDSHYRDGNLNSALKCYLEILSEKEKENMSNSFYGRIAYTVGTIYAMLFMSKSANAYFSYAYELAPDPVYSRACVYMSLLIGDDEELLSAIVRYKITDDELDAMKQRVKATRQEIEHSEETLLLEEQLKDAEFADDIQKLWKENYYKMLK